MAASRQQHRPVRRAFRLLNTALACLLLLISTLSTPAIAGTSAKVLRHGVQKTAGYPSANTDIDCRKRAGAAKVTPLDNPGAGLACLPAQAERRLKRVFAAPAFVPPFRPGSETLETRGARAPPWNFA